MIKPVYSGLSILEINQIVITEFGYDYVKPKHSEQAKLCYMYTDWLHYGLDKNIRNLRRQCKVC